MAQRKRSKKSLELDQKKAAQRNKIEKTETEKRRIGALYYIYNCGLPQITDELSFQKARQKFISLFPEFSEGAPEKFDPAGVKSSRNEVLNILRMLPREKKIWSEELVIRIFESLDLAHESLSRIARNILGEEFPHPFTDDETVKEAIKIYERLEKKFSEIHSNIQSMTLSERNSYERSQIEARYAWDIFLLNASQRTLFKEKNTNPNELFCYFYELGKSVGLLKTLTEEQFNLMQEAAARVKSSDAVTSGRWKDKRKKREKAKSIADNIWTKGDTALHTEMADYLYDNSKYPQLTGLSRNEILSAIKPVANKHNRLFGKKGVTKNK